jgi:hypothetical protein
MEGIESELDWAVGKGAVMRALSRKGRPRLID